MDFTNVLPGDMTAEEYIAKLVTESNLQLFKALDRAQKVLVMEEPRGPSQLIEIPVTINALTKQIFPDVQNLRSQVGQTIVIKSMKLIIPQVLTNAPIGGQIVAPLTELAKISVVIYCEGWEKGQIIPILTFNDMFVDTVAVPARHDKIRFNNWKNVDWSKTFLLYSNGTSSAGTPYSVLFDVEYIKIDAQNQEIIGAS